MMKKSPIPIPPMTDIHCHILPGIDDGSKDIATTIDMLKIARSEGITRIIATPHYRSGRFPVRRERQLQLLAEVQQLADELGIDVSLYLGNEIYYRSELEEKLTSGSLSTMNNTEYILIEFSPTEAFLYIRNAVDDVLSLGYTPIIAHIERYQCICKKPEYAKELKSMGCEIQVNAASILGETGFACKRFTHALLKQQLVDYVGTDAHSPNGRKPAMRRCAELLYKKYERAYVDALLSDNAAKRLNTV